MVSSTSWTDDEDFGLLFDALKLYDVTARNHSKYPKIVAIVTGILNTTLKKLSLIMDLEVPVI